jgi:hypothetical protein
MTLIEVETSFGVVAAGEQALIDAIRALLLSEQANPPLPDDLPEAISF